MFRSPNHSTIEERILGKLAHTVQDESLLWRLAFRQKRQKCRCGHASLHQVRGDMDRGTIQVDLVAWGNCSAFKHVQKQTKRRFQIQKEPSKQVNTKVLRNFKCDYGQKVGHQEVGILKDKKKKKKQKN